MTIEKTTRINNLIDIYFPLLTKKQQEIMEMYFVYDLSLKEITESTNTTRAAVFDLIKRTCNVLEDYESKLCLLKKKDNIIKIISNLDEKTRNEIEKNL